MRKTEKTEKQKIVYLGQNIENSLSKKNIKDIHGNKRLRQMRTLGK